MIHWLSLSALFPFLFPLLSLLLLSLPLRPRLFVWVRDDVSTSTAADESAHLSHASHQQEEKADDLLLVPLNNVFGRASDHFDFEVGLHERDGDVDVLHLLDVECWFSCVPPYRLPCDVLEKTNEYQPVTEVSVEVGGQVYF